MTEPYYVRNTNGCDFDACSTACYKEEGVVLMGSLSGSPMWEDVSCGNEQGLYVDRSGVTDNGFGCGSLSLSGGYQQELEAVMNGIIDTL